MGSSSNITGLILAGGAGRRVGLRDKGLIEWRGRPLVSHVCDRLKPQVDELLISCNRNLSRYQDYTQQVVVDDRKDFQGPLAGLEAASTRLHTEYLAVVSCDMPEIPPDLVKRLLKPFVQERNGSPEISYAHDGSRSQYLCAVLKRDCLQTLQSFLNEGHRAVRDWYRQHDAVAVDFSDCSACFQNHNRLD